MAPFKNDAVVTRAHGPRQTFTVKVKMARDGKELAMPIEAVGFPDQPWLDKMDADNRPAEPSSPTPGQRHRFVPRRCTPATVVTTKGGAGGAGTQWPSAEQAAAAQQATTAQQQQLAAQQQQYVAAAMQQQQYAAMQQQQYAAMGYGMDQVTRATPLSHSAARSSCRLGPDTCHHATPPSSVGTRTTQTCVPLSKAGQTIRKRSSTRADPHATCLTLASRRAQAAVMQQQQYAAAQAAAMHAAAATPAAAAAADPTLPAGWTSAVDTSTGDPRP